MNAFTDFFKDKKVIVTGGAGFIGSHICDELVRQGAIVHSVDNYSAGKKENISHLLPNKNFTEHNIDICDRNSMDAILPNTDIIFNNAASKKNVCLVDPQKDLLVNAGGTLNLLELSLKHKVKKFVHASTGSVYGEPTIFPSDETHPLKPVSYYGVSKLAGERYVDVFNKLYGLDTTILRYFHVYGPRQESNEFGGVVSIFLRNIIENKPLTVFGSGEQVRSFTWVKDLVRVNLSAAVLPSAKGQVYNAASGIQISINSLAQGLVDLMQGKVKIVHGEPLVGDIFHFEVSNEKVKRELDIVFETNFWANMSQTLEQFLNYFEKNLGKKV